jgi:hypothetical protein
MLDRKMLEDMPLGTIFADGVNNDHVGYRDFRWIAIRGGIADWAIYYDRTTNNMDWVRNYGAKMLNPEKIRELVPCEDEAFEMYRY